MRTLFRPGPAAAGIAIFQRRCAFILVAPASREVRVLLSTCTGVHNSRVFPLFCHIIAILVRFFRHVFSAVRLPYDNYSYEHKLCKACPINIIRSMVQKMGYPLL